MSQEESVSQETKQSDASLTKIAAADYGLKTMELLREDQRYCDAVIEAGSERFKIHKSVFGIHSNFFDKAFTVEMKEKYDEVVKVENVSGEVMKSIVDFLYSGEITTTPDNVVEIFLAADFLMIEFLKAQCVKTMIECLDEQNYIDRWRLAKKFNLFELIDQSLTFVIGHLKSITGRESFMSLSYEEVEEVVRFGYNKDVSQEIVYTASLTWVKHSVEDREEKFEALFEILDCSKFSKAFLETTAKDEPLLRRSPTSLGAVVDELITRINKLSQEKRNLKIESDANVRRCEELNKSIKTYAHEERKWDLERYQLKDKVQIATSTAILICNEVAKDENMKRGNKQRIHNLLCKINVSLNTLGYY